MSFKKSLIIGVFCTLFVACSGSGNNSGAVDEATNSESSTPGTLAPSLKEITSLLLDDLNRILDPQIPGWDCQGDNPLRDSMGLTEVYESLRRNCAWSEIDGVIKISFRCFLSTQNRPDEQAKCKDQLNRLATDTGVISLTEAALIPEQSMIDGVQISTTGVATWNINDGLNFVLDVAKWSEIKP